MDALLIFVGVLLGLILWTRVAAWTIGAMSLRKEGAKMATVDESSAKKILYPMVGWWWLIVGSILAYLVIRSTPDGRFGWIWFFAGMALTPLLVLTNFFFVARRIKVRKTEAK